MTYMDKAFGARATIVDGNDPRARPVREALILVVEDDHQLSGALRSICDCLNVTVERIPSHNELGPLLHQRCPMAIVAEMEAEGQDGCHVLMTVAAHDRDLPVLLVTGDDPALLGAIDAVEELWQLTSVVKWPLMPGVGGIVDFLFHAGRKGGCMRLLPV
jgi:hypothetical protein